MGPAFACSTSFQQQSITSSESPSSSFTASSFTPYQSGVTKYGEKKWMLCPYCRKERKAQRQIEREIRYHIHYKPFTCVYCDFTSSSSDYAHSHILKEHVGQPIAMKYIRVEAKEKRWVLMANPYLLEPYWLNVYIKLSYRNLYQKAKVGNRVSSFSFEFLLWIFASNVC